MSDNGAKGPKHVLLRSKGQRTGGKASPWRAPYGVACGQALQPCGLNGGLTTGSRPRRASTPFLIENFPIPHSPVQKNRLRFVRFPEHTHPAVDQLIIREILFKPTEPLLLRADYKFEPLVVRD